LSRFSQQKEKIRKTIRALSFFGWPQSLHRQYFSFQELPDHESERFPAFVPAFSGDLDTEVADSL